MILLNDLHQKFIDDAHGNISTDTRTLENGDMFFAWKGGEFDGNQFAMEALKKGASWVIVDDAPIATQDERILYTENSMQLLQKLATFHRNQFDIPIVAITGSNGKTTTKELVASVLSQQKKVVASSGNYNNHVGVPLTLLRIQDDTDIAVIEMGANQCGDIYELCTLAHPTHGLITNIGKAHIGYFGGIGGVIEAKTEMYHYLQEHNGEIFVNASDDLLMKYSEGLNRILYGDQVQGSLQVTSLKTVPHVSVQWDHIGSMTSHLTGEYNVQNIACAIAVGSYFNITSQNVQKGIENYQPENKRSEMSTTLMGNILISDYYNANPTSMQHALDNLMTLKKEHYQEYTSYAILGDMFELGDYSAQEHQEIAEYAISQGVDEIILVGEDFASIKVPAEHQHIHAFSERDEAVAYLKTKLFSQSLILLKASNGMKFQHIVDVMTW